MIPLGKVENDFNNCTFIVTNLKRNLALFKFVNNNTPTIPNITKANIKKDTVLSNSDTGVMIVKDLAGGVYGLNSIIVDISKIMQKKVPLIIMTETNKVFTAHASNPVREYSNWALVMMESTNINFV